MATAIGSAPAARASVTAKAFFIIMVDGYDTLMISFIAPLLTKRLSLAPGQIGSLFAAGYLGAVIGGLLIGPLADRVGRRPVLVACMLLAAAATAMCGLTETREQLMALRFVAGIGLGGAVPVVIALTADAAPPERRGRTVTTMYIGFPLGAVVGGALTSALLGVGTSAIFVAAGLVCLVAAGVAATLPRMAPASDRRPAGRALFTAQFADGRLLPALALWVGLFSTLVLTYFLVSWTPTLIAAAGGSPQVAALGPVLLNLGGITGALLSARLIDRWGPYLLNAMLILAGAGLVALLGQDLGNVPLTLGLLFLTGMLVLGAQLNVPAMVAELFPAPVRAAGAGWTGSFGRLGSIVGPLVGGWLVARSLPNAELFGFAAIPALIAAAMLFAIHRLRRGSVHHPR